MHSTLASPPGHPSMDLASACTWTNLSWLVQLSSLLVHIHTDARFGEDADTCCPSTPTSPLGCDPRFCFSCQRGSLHDTEPWSSCHHLVLGHTLFLAHSSRLKTPAAAVSGTETRGQDTHSPASLQQLAYQFWRTYTQVSPQLALSP